jgi:D-methionine transport system permease protein
MAEAISAFWSQYGNLLMVGLRDTLVMTILSTLFAYVLGLPMGVLLNITQPHGIWPKKWVNRVLGWIVNVGRSLPFIILMIAVMGFTKLLVGTKIGVRGAIPPLVISAAPFIARMVESSLKEVSPGVIEAARSMGASNWTIVFRVLLVEAKTSLIVGATITLGTILGYSAMAGTVGGGGLGDIAIRYGYNRWQTDIMLITVALLVILFQIFQMIGMKIASALDHRK